MTSKASNQSEPDPLRELVLVVTERLKEAACEISRSSIYPIVAVDERGKATPVGTAFVFCHSDKRWLVTAGHVLDEAKSEPKIELFTLSKNTENKVDFRLDPEKFQRAICRNDDGRDIVDIAFAPLEAFPGFDQAAGYLESSSAGQARSRDKCLLKHLVYGFPETKNRKSLGFDPARRTKSQDPPALQPITGTEKPPTPSLEKEKFTSDRHVFIEYAPAQLVDIDQNKANLYPLNGMSGAPVVFLGDLSTKEVLLRGRTPKSSVSGVFIEHSKKDRRLIATRVEVLQETIDHYLSGAKDGL